MNMIEIQKYTSPFIFNYSNGLYSAKYHSKKTVCISHFWLWIQIHIAIYTDNVITFQIWKSEGIINLIINTKNYIYVREIWKEFN